MSSTCSHKWKFPITVSSILRSSWLLGSHQQHPSPAKTSAVSRHCDLVSYSDVRMDFSWNKEFIQIESISPAGSKYTVFILCCHLSISFWSSHHSNPSDLTIILSLSASKTVLYCLQLSSHCSFGTHSSAPCFPQSWSKKWLSSKSCPVSSTGILFEVTSMHFPRQRGLRQKTSLVSRWMRLLSAHCTKYWTVISTLH